MCWPLAWTERRGQRCSRRWPAAEGEAPGAGLRPEASHGTFNVLVGAQPVPSIECSRSKLKHRRAGGHRGRRRACEGRACERRRQVLSAGGLSSGAAPSLCPRPCARGWTRAQSKLPCYLYSRRTRAFHPDGRGGSRRGRSALRTEHRRACVSPVVRAEGTTRTAGPTDTRRLPLLRRLHQASETRQGVAALPDPSRWANATSG